MLICIRRLDHLKSYGSGGIGMKYFFTPISHDLNLGTRGAELAANTNVQTLKASYLLIYCVGLGNLKIDMFRAKQNMSKRHKNLNCVSSQSRPYRLLRNGGNISDFLHADSNEQ